MIILLFLFYVIVICSGTCSFSSTDGSLFGSELLFDCKQQKRVGNHLQEGVEQFISRIQFPQHSMQGGMILHMQHNTSKMFPDPIFEYLIMRDQFLNL
jgi:hypothetical protein